MELNVSKESENKLMGRKEIEVGASFDAVTPSRSDVKEAVCKKMGLHPDLVEIVRIDQAYGTKECRVTVYAYDSKEDMAKGFNRKGKEKKEGTAPAAAAAPAKDEKKEAAKEEKKE
ncbi:MAG: hypothetical protein KGH69_03490 [Candidatus Micrarchaeota archaeon]|nr:hypothetical protein [Candidatus Micrarchaeota archaeon]